MKWFRRREDPYRPGRAGGEPPAPVRPARKRDWRSYDSVAEDYERAVARHTAPVFAELLRLAEPLGPVLDVGTGTGAAIEGVADAVGIDVSEPMLRAGRASRRVPVAAADVLDLPFKESAFDVVTANFVLPYFTKLETALFDMIRVLRPGGRLAVSVWAAGEDELSRTWRQMVEQTLGLEMYRQAIKDGTPWAERLADAARLETALRDAGLRPVRVQKHKDRQTLSREEYIVGKELEPLGRFVRRMLSDSLWESFRARVRARYAETFAEQIGDFRDILLAVGTKRG